MVMPRRKPIIEQKADAFSDRIVLMYKYLNANKFYNLRIWDDSNFFCIHISYTSRHCQSRIIFS